MIDICPSFSAVTNINSWRAKSALLNVVSLHCPRYFSLGLISPLFFSDWLQVHKIQGMLWFGSCCKLKGKGGRESKKKPRSEGAKQRPSYLDNNIVVVACQSPAETRPNFFGNFRARKSKFGLREIFGPKSLKFQININLVDRRIWGLLNCEKIGREKQSVRFGCQKNACMSWPSLQLFCCCCSSSLLDRPFYNFRACKYQYWRILCSSETSIQEFLRHWNCGRFGRSHVFISGWLVRTANNKLTLCSRGCSRAVRVTTFDHAQLTSGLQDRPPTRPTFSKLSSFEIRRSTFLAYIEFGDLPILRL